VKEIVLPSGHRESVQPGALFTEGNAQGVYQLVVASGPKSMRAVNLADLTASDLTNVPPISVATAATSAIPASSIVRAPLAAYFLAAIIALVVIESLLVYRRRNAVEV
ncbi:MAG TPA: hypothetical protein VN742_01640, partial [Candidatus Binataceae bacterium]|nr:hypothetical protein [Candidatus Binataceae bacterium]